MDDRFHPRFLKNREALVGKLDRVTDLIEIIRQKFMTEVPRGPVNRPGLTPLLIKTDTKPATLLTQITLTTRVHHVGMLDGALVNVRNVVRYNILMLHRMQRQVDACHGAHFSGP